MAVNYWAFPEDVGKGINGHYIIFTGYSQTTGSQAVTSASGGIIPTVGSSGSGVVDNIRIFIPGGSQSPFAYQQEHLYTDVKLARVADAATLGVSGVLTGSTAANYVGQKLFGKMLNPGVDIMFQSTPLRRFQFNFIMSPSSKTEAKSMKDIIQAFRFHAAPQFDNGKLSFIVPDVFDIKFYYIGSEGNPIENTNIPKINTCVMERIDVDYTPQGEWSTFTDGNPTSCMITTIFRELQVIDRNQIKAGY
jgi:hypothetical protein